MYRVQSVTLYFSRKLSYNLCTGTPNSLLPSRFLIIILQALLVYPRIFSSSLKIYPLQRGHNYTLLMRRMFLLIWAIIPETCCWITYNKKIKYPQPRYIPKASELVFRFIDCLQIVATALSLIHTHSSSLQHVLSPFSMLSLPQSLTGNGYQRLTFTHRSTRSTLLHCTN
jgi:hypothetical protein